jgi:hypothetical protein
VLFTTTPIAAGAQNATAQAFPQLLQFPGVLAQARAMHCILREIRGPT